VSLPEAPHHDQAHSLRRRPRGHRPPRIGRAVRFLQARKGAAADFTPTSSFACTGGDLCSPNVGAGTFNGSLTYTDGGVSVTATGTLNGVVAAVVQDHQSNWTFASSAGLGVYHSPLDTSDDNITVGESLTLTFAQMVTVSAIGLRAEGHNYTNWAANSTFLFNGVSTLLPNGSGMIGGLNLTGDTFTFAYGGTKPSQFYLASITVTPVPEPEIVALMLAGLGATGFVARRRKQRLA